jgi:hypothetical protein
VNTNFGGAASLRQRSSNSPRRVEVHAHADVELRFGLAAHDGRRDEHGVEYPCATARSSTEASAMSPTMDRTRLSANAAAGATSSKEIDAISRVRPLASVSVLRSAQLARKPRAQEPGAAGDDDVHVCRLLPAI